MYQDYFTAIQNDDSDKCLKAYASTGKKNIQTVFRSIYHYEMDRILRTYSGEQYANSRPEELITKYKNIKNNLNYYDNLPTRASVSY